MRQSRVAGLEAPPRCAKSTTDRCRRRVRPIEPNGTRPISILCPESRSHSSEPTPMPTENTTSSSVTTCSVPCSTLRDEVRELRDEHRAVEPEPRDAEDREEHRAVAGGEPRLRQVSATGFQLMRSSGSGGGRARDEARQHDAAAPRSRRCRCATPAMPQSGWAIIQPPKIMPSRIAIEVPVSTSALPPISSDSFSCCGRIAYFTGPNSVDCTPPRKSAASSSGRFCSEEADRAERHDRELERHRDRDEPRLLVLVGDLARGGREQEERQDEQRLREVLQRVRRHRGEARRLVGEQDHQRLLEDVVVERAEELHAEERPEAPLGQQPELARGQPIDSLRKRARLMRARAMRAARRYAAPRCIATPRARWLGKSGCPGSWRQLPKCSWYFAPLENRQPPFPDWARSARIRSLRKCRDAPAALAMPRCPAGMRPSP